MLNTTRQPACYSPIYVNIADQSLSKNSDGVQIFYHHFLTKNSKKRKKKLQTYCTAEEAAHFELWSEQDDENNTSKQ